VENQVHPEKAVQEARAVFAVNDGKYSVKAAA
jgi:hypothetical protein